MDSFPLGGIRMKIKKIDDKMIEGIIERINELLGQLSEKARKLAKEDLKRIFSQPGFYLVVIFNGKKLVGMASIHFRETLMHKVGIIEDVVVDESYRGCKLGEKLNKILIEEAKKRGVEYIELTSKPQRKIANILYKKLGFKKPKTNYLRLYL